jgi:holo-[acyl-carrier protein] synthase
MERIKSLEFDRFSKKILSDTELKEYELINHDNRKLSYLAGRFAAKKPYSSVLRQAIKLQIIKIFPF